MKEKLSEQPNRILFKLWHQLKPEQQLQPLRSTTWKLETKAHFWPVCQQYLLGKDMQNPAGPLPEDSWALCPILGDLAGASCNKGPMLSK